MTQEEQKIIESLVAVLMIAAGLYVWALGSLASPEKAPFNKIADQLERFANWADKLADKLEAWRAAERDRRKGIEK